VSEQDGSSKITLRPVVETGETQAKGPEQGLNKSFHVCDLNRILDQGLGKKRDAGRGASLKGNHRFGEGNGNSAEPNRRY
jgi:hypothetical protein